MLGLFSFLLLLFFFFNVLVQTCRKYHRGADPKSRLDTPGWLPSPALQRRRPHTRWQYLGEPPEDEADMARHQSRNRGQLGQLALLKGDQRGLVNEISGARHQT